LRWLAKASLESQGFEKWQALFDDYNRRGPKPASNPPTFLVGSRPSFLEVVASHPSFLKRGAEKEEADQGKLEAVPPEVDLLSKSTIRLERFAKSKWLIATTLVSILCSAWIAGSIYELHEFAVRQGTSVSETLRSPGMQYSLRTGGPKRQKNRMISLRKPLEANSAPTSAFSGSRRKMRSKKCHQASTTRTSVRPPHYASEL
jgi:hypothetical protein